MITGPFYAYGVHPLDLFIQRAHNLHNLNNHNLHNQINYENYKIQERVTKELLADRAAMMEARSQARPQNLNPYTLNPKHPKP